MSDWCEDIRTRFASSDPELLTILGQIRRMQEVAKAEKLDPLHLVVDGVPDTNREARLRRRDSRELIFSPPPA